MKKRVHTLASLMQGAGGILVLSAGLCIAAQGQQKGQSAMTLGIRQHIEHDETYELPVGDDDLGYLAAYEYHEGSGLWQIGLGWAPEVTGGTNEVDCMLTPQLHLLYLYRDGLWSGVGICRSYVRSDASYWTSWYWQFQLGLQLPVSDALTIRVGAYYIFDKWGDFFHLDSDDVEFGSSLTLTF